MRGRAGLPGAPGLPPPPPPLATAPLPGPSSRQTGVPGGSNPSVPGPLWGHPGCPVTAPLLGVAPPPATSLGSQPPACSGREERKARVDAPPLGDSEPTPPAMRGGPS